jgi:ABC-type transporter Mla subunit MlaD
MWPEESDVPHVKVVLQLEVEPDTAAFLRSESRVTVEKTITGITAVVIREGAGERLEPGKPLRGEAGMAIEELAAEAQSVGKSINELIADVRGVVADIREGDRVEKILSAFQRASTDIEEACADVRDFTGRSKGPWMRSMENIDAFAQRLTEFLQSIEAPVVSVIDDVKIFAEAVAPHAAELSEAIESARSAAADLADAVSEARSFLTRNRHRLDGTVRDVAEAADNISEATAEIRRQPWRLLYRPDAEECSTLSILDAVREYNIATANLQRSLEELLVIKEGPPEMRALAEKAVGTAEAALGQYRKAEAALWAELRR